MTEIASNYSIAKYDKHSVYFNEYVFNTTLTVTVTHTSYNNRISGSLVHTQSNSGITTDKVLNVLILLQANKVQNSIM